MKALAILFFSLFITACMHETENPRDIASQYWQALKNGDTATARSLVSSDSQQAFDDYVSQPDDRRTAIGEVNLGTEQTTVITIIYPEGNTPDDFDTFDTVMVMEDGKWKIDAGRTIIPRPAPSEHELDELPGSLPLDHQFPTLVEDHVDLVLFAGKTRIRHLARFEFMFLEIALQGASLVVVQFAGM